MVRVGENYYRASGQQAGMALQLLRIAIWQLRKLRR